MRRTCPACGRRRELHPYTFFSVQLDICKNFLLCDSCNDWRVRLIKENDERMLRFLRGEPEPVARTYGSGYPIEAMR